MTLVTKGLLEVGLLAGATLAASSIPSWVWPLVAGVLLKALVDRFRDVKLAKVKAAEALAAADREQDVKIAELKMAQGITSAIMESWRRELTHYHTPELDELMLIPPWELTEAQWARMVVLFEERSRDRHDEIPAEERELAKLYMPMLRRAVVEREVLQTKGRRLQTVAVTQTEPNGAA